MVRQLLKGIEGVLIPVKDPSISVKWLKGKLEFKSMYMEEEVAVMKKHGF